MRDFERESTISKRYQVIATINNAPAARPSLGVSEADQSEYVAIMEGFDLPLYFILYDVSYS